MQCNEEYMYTSFYHPDVGVHYFCGGLLTLVADKFTLSDNVMRVLASTVTVNGSKK